jgi:hypothetical protein
MTTKVSIAAVFVLAMLTSLNTAQSAGWSRGQCIDAVHQKLGSYSADSGRGTLSRSAIRRCLRYGPSAI